jgi:hypothetical protein
VLSRIFLIASKIGQSSGKFLGMLCQVSGKERGRIPESGASKIIAGLFIRKLVKLVNLAL